MAHIQGRKSGSSKPSSPKESPDSLHSVATAKILLALSEGECAGGLTDKDIYLDGTPVRAQDGTLNFPGVTWEYRPGTQAQEYIQGIPSVENEISINTPLKQTQPWTRAISNTQLSALRVRLGLPALQLQKDNGDVVGSRVEYKIELATDGGAYQTVVNGAFDGKTTSLYERSHRIDLPKATTGWQVRVTRLTADSVSNRVANATNIEAYAEVIDAKLRYPNTELLFVTFDAKQFSNIPQISVKAPGRLIRVPATYDPVARTYSGTWDGSFKWAYSNNPAWVFYDIVLNPRFGLGDRLDASQVDKWELYRIAQYCDQLVPDGFGGSGTEPRFLCDVYIQSQNEAFNVLRDLASIFRGMTYWANNQLFSLADQPRDMTYIFTRANVIGGKFVYAGGSERNRYSTAMVSWSNPDNHYSDEVEAVVEQDLVRRYGVRQTEITAIGCVRRTEANRRGRWVLLTNAKDRLVTFSTGLEGMIPLPGHIIGVADQSLSGKVMGGRISGVNGRVITLDRVADVKAGSRLILNLPSGISQARTVQAVNERQVTVTTTYSETPEVQAVWSVDADDLFIQQYRVTGVTDNDDATFTIAAINHNPDKYAAIDSGARLDERPISAIPPGVQAPPASVAISSYSRVVQNISVETMRVTWDTVPNAIAYECEWRKDNGDWVNAPRTSSLGFEVPGIYSGRYTARVRAINSSDISSIWTSSLEVELTGKVGQPPMPLNFRTSPLLWGVQIDWDFPADTADTLQTEVQYSTTSTGAAPMLLTDVPYPQHMYSQMGLKAGQGFWYRARLIDRIGNQSAWTTWIAGSSSSEAGDYLVDIDNQLQQTDSYKNLVKDITDLTGDVQSAKDDIKAVTTESATTKTGLAQEVADRTQAISDEAQARGQALLTEKNERVADISNVNQSIQTSTESLAQQIAQVSAGTGSQFDPLKIWFFDTNADGWKTGVGTEPVFNNGWIKSTDTALVSPTVAVSGSSYRFVKLRIRKTGSQSSATFKLEWREGAETGFPHHVDIDPPVFDASGISTVEIADIAWGADVKQFRIVSSVAPTLTDFIETDWIAVGRPTPGAGMAALQQESTARVAGDQAEATARETLATQIRGGYTGSDPSKLAAGLLYTERQARITAQQAEVTERTKLESTVNNNHSSVTQELATLTTEQSAQASTLSGLQTTVGKNTADITAVTKAVTDNDHAQTTALNAVKATTDQNTADIGSETTARTDGDSALGRRIDTLKLDVDGNTASGESGIVANVTNALAAFTSFSIQRVTFANGETKTLAEINDVRKTAADANSALAEQVTTLKATVEHDGQTNTAAITRIDKTVSDLEKSTATSIQQVTASIGQTNANVQTTSEAVADIDGKLNAQWGVKVQTEANGVKRIAGIQLGIDATGSSNFLVSADTFAVYNPNTGGQEIVFAATGGQLFVRDAFIQNGSISDAKIGNVIKSYNWDASGGTQGWAIVKDGWATFNNVTVRGTVYATDGSFTGTIYGNNGWFKGTVYAEHIEGDVTKVYVVNPNTSIDIPAMPFNRAIHIPLICATSGGTGSQGTAVNVHITGGVTADATAATAGNGPASVTNLTAYLPAGRTCNVQHLKTGNGATGGAIAVLVMRN